MLLYRGYIGQIEYDADEDVFVGEVVNTSDLLEFRGKDVAEVKMDFHQCVDQYILMQKQMESSLASPFIGRFNLFLSPQQQRLVINAARVEGINVESWLNRQLNQYLFHYFHQDDAQAS